jgi:membrane associated rhomboid family serine protease
VERRVFMPKRDGWRTERFALPYEKSAIASGALIVAFLLFLGTLAEPQTGRIRDQIAAWLAIFGLPFAIAAVFYVEYSFRNRRIDSPRRSSSKSNLSAKC